MKIFKEKRGKISEQILAVLYSSLKPLFTSQISQEIARDEEFTKKLLLEMKEQNFIIEIKKNPLGKIYLKRARWKLNNKIYEAYKKASSIKEYT